MPAGSILLTALTQLADPFTSAIPLSRPVEETSVWASWFLSPQQHITEFLVYNTVFPIALILLFRRLSRALSANPVAHNKPASSTLSDSTRNSVLLIAASYAYTANDKLQRETAWFLLQPCHVSCVALCALLMAPRSWRHRNLLFNVYLNLQWGAVVALLNPDLRGYDTFLGVFNFFFEHILILLVPFYHIIVTREFTLLPASSTLCLFSFGVLALYHSVLLEVTCLATGHNLNYMFYPPPGPLASFGTLYRPVMFVSCIGFTFIMRYGIIEALQRSLQWVAALSTARLRRDTSADLHQTAVSGIRREKSITAQLNLATQSSKFETASVSLEHMEILKTVASSAVESL
ncbi:hypothetical protein RI367_006593 [Sorochytrium milnesiophthora]